MTKASDNKFPKVYLEERLTDGSDTTTPAADHRSLFLGEDGLLHLKDSAAAVTDVGSSSGGGRPRLDSDTLQATYGDDFTATTLAAKWTRHNITQGDEGFDGSTEGWMSLNLADIANDASWYQSTFTTTDEFELVLSVTMYYYASTANTRYGAYIADSSGNGVAVTIYGGTMALDTITARDYTAQQQTLTFGADDAWQDQKAWINIVKKGSLYFGRYSFDGNTWSRYSTHYSSAITVAQIGHGRIDETSSAEQKQYRVDRFNVINRLNRSANRVITPSSGTSTYSASSTFGGFPVGNAADANTTTQWIANGSADSPTYWQCAWSVAQSINRVMIFHHTGDNYGSGYIEFSDGSRVPFGQKLVAGTWTPIDFPTISTTLLKVVSLRGKGTNPSLGEVEAYLAS